LELKKTPVVVVVAAPQRRAKFCPSSQQKKKKKKTLHMTPAGVEKTPTSTPGRMDGGWT